MTKDSDSKKDFSSVLLQLVEQGNWHRFDTFIIRYMGFECEGGQPDEGLRKEAYHEFLHRQNERRCASLPTIRRWFGISSYRMPTREQIYQICFALKLQTAETEQFLKEGIGEPSFQINDYHEMIAMYVLENRLGAEKYESLLNEYEKKIFHNKEVSSEETDHVSTRWLFQQFENIKSIPEGDFLCWMWEHTDSFKGYSKTVQDYLELYRKKVVEYVRMEVKERLKLLLSETEYPMWRERKRVGNKNEGERIKRYLAADVRRKDPEISEGLRKNILELTNIAYSERGYNSQMISELFEPWNRVRVNQRGILPRQSVKIMSGKYVSDLFNIPARSEQAMKIRKAVSRLDQMEPVDALPEDLAGLVKEYSGEAISEVAAAKEFLEDYERENKRRRLLVQRNDLLPLIFHVSQQDYIHENKEKQVSYEAESAKKRFVDLANTTLLACNMEPVNSSYLFDAILLACFQKDEMYTYADVLDYV